MRRLRPVALLVVLGLLVVVAAGCASSTRKPNRRSSNLTIESVAPKTLLPGSKLVVRGGPFHEGDSVSLRFDGRTGDDAVQFVRSAEIRDGDAVVTSIDRDFYDNLKTAEGSFSAKLHLEVRRENRTVTAGRKVEFRLTDGLEPRLDGLETRTAAFMDEIGVDGSGFLLEGEGRTFFRFEGTFESASGDRRSIEEALVPLEPDRREHALYVHRPEAFGLHPGTFEGTVTVENWHDGPGGEIVGDSISVTLEVPEPRLDSVEPRAISRGQRLAAFGIGFVERDSEARQRTTLILEGTFTATDGSTTRYQGAKAITMATELRQAGQLSYVLRPTVAGADGLEGLGSETGVFEGEAWARLRRGASTLETNRRPVRLKILPTKQVVHVKFLPGFSKSLRKFGLRNVERRIRERVLEVCNRDYRPYNVVCRDSPPEEYADYTVIEVGGRDPNDGSLFGLDNSKGIDRGNQRLDEVVGGRRATDQDAENFSYGGVFIESFLMLSPKLTGPIPIQSKKFDAIFGPFIPKLGGKPVQVDEYPAGSRADEIARAIRVLGNLVGNTTVHEVGHALGLAVTDNPAQVHHSGEKSNLIMNRGVDRSFARRAELEGTEPAIWGERDSRYLERILPKP